MEPHDRPRRFECRLVAPAVGAWAAAAGCTLLAPRTAATIAIVGCVVALLSWRLAGNLRVVVIGVVVGVGLGAATSAWHVHALRIGPVPLLAAHRSDVEVVARLVRDPVAVATAAGSHLTLTDATVTSVLDGTWRSA